MTDSIDFVHALAKRFNLHTCDIYRYELGDDVVKIGISGSLDEGEFRDRLSALIKNYGRYVLDYCIYGSVSASLNLVIKLINNEDERSESSMGVV